DLERANEVDELCAHLLVREREPSPGCREHIQPSLERRAVPRLELALGLLPELPPRAFVLNPEHAQGASDGQAQPVAAGAPSEGAIEPERRLPSAAVAVVDGGTTRGHDRVLVVAEERHRGCLLDRRERSRLLHHEERGWKRHTRLGGWE